MPRNPDLHTTTVQLDSQLRTALEDFRVLHRFKYDSDAIRLILRDRFTADGLLKPPQPPAP